MGKINFKSFLNFIAFVAIVFIGVALIVKGILGADNQVGVALELVAQIIAYAMLAIYGFFYARSKRSIVFLIVWIVSVVLIVVSYVI